MARGDTDSRKTRPLVDTLQLASKVRDTFDVGYFRDRAQACAGGNHIKLCPQTGMADLHPRLAKMAVVENNDRKISRFLRCNGQQAADTHQLLAIPGDDGDGRVRAGAGAT